MNLSVSSSNKVINLYKERKKNELRQIDVASAVGITRTQYNLIENRKSDLTLTVARDISDFFGKTIDYLFGN